MVRSALITGTVGGIIGAITAGIGVIWSIALMLYLISVESYKSQVLSISLLIGPYATAFIPSESLVNSVINSVELSHLLGTILILLGLLLIVAGILTGVGFFGLYQAGGGAMGIVGLIGGIMSVPAALFIFLGGTSVTIIEWLVVYRVPMMGTPYFWFVPIFGPNTPSIWIGLIILAIALILLGAASITVRGTTEAPMAAEAAGILSIIGACLLFPFTIMTVGSILALFGFGLILVAFILWVRVFYKSRES